MNKGGVFIISGPSGSGKDTVMTELFKKMPELLFSISCAISRALCATSITRRYLLS